MNDLQIIGELREALPRADEEAWRLIERLGALLDQDARHSEYERALFRRLRSAVTDAIIDKREGRNPEVANSRIALGALESSIKKRTIGPDGWPLAR